MPSPQPEQVIKIVLNPQDVTKLGISISESLEKWAENEHNTAVCFDPITALLRATTNLPMTLRFLHTLIGRVRVAEARACYTFDPDTHADETTTTLTDLFTTEFDARRWVGQVIKVRRTQAQYYQS